MERKTSACLRKQHNDVGSRLILPSVITCTNDNLHELDLVQGLSCPVRIPAIDFVGQNDKSWKTRSRACDVGVKSKGIEIPHYMKGCGIDLKSEMPPSTRKYVKAMDRLRFHPEKARALYQRFPESPSVSLEMYSLTSDTMGKFNCARGATTKRFVLGKLPGNDTGPD